MPTLEDLFTEPPPAPEGSDHRREARAILLYRANDACRSGCSFDGWLERTDSGLLHLVSQKDLDTIFQLVWKGKFGRMKREG